MSLLLLSLICTFTLPSFGHTVMKQERTDNLVSLLALGAGPLTFKWDNCSSERNVALHIRSGSIAPDPVPLPGTITVSVNLTLTKTLKAPLKAAVTLQKRVGNKNVTIPCIDNIGSCMYDDLCELIPPLSMCPPPLSTYHIPCQCPFAAGNYYLPPYEFDLPDPGGNVPSWLVSGEYHGKAVLTDADGGHAGCYEVFLGLKLD